MDGATRYRSSIDLQDTNNAHTLLILGTGEGKSVLEVGPASGYITEALTNRGCTLTCIESDVEAAAIASAFCERMIVGDIERVDLRAELGDARFDVIMFGDVLEHLVDPGAVLTRVRLFLAPGGYVIASIPNVSHGSIRLGLLAGRFRYTEWGLLDRTHIRFFTRSTAEAMFAASGYGVGHLDRVTVDPFATEQEIEEADYPPEMSDLVREDVEAMTYQFVIKASPSAEGHQSISPDEFLRCPTLESIWELHHRTNELHHRTNELYEIIVEKDRHIANLQAMTKEKDGHIANLSQIVSEGDDEITRLRANLRRAQKYSLVRLAGALRQLARKIKKRQER